jgi:ribose-phosphate pyrophosphokinase
MSSDGAVLLGFPEYEAPARRLAEAAGMTYQCVRIHRFPDGESQVTVPARLPPRIVLCRSLDHPNDKLVELRLAVAAARAAGAEVVTLVAPYLCYMRQDKAFAAGQAVSQRVIGEMLAESFDGVVTVDPHLHRIHTLAEAVPTPVAVALHATRPIADFIEERFSEPLLLGPDGESEQWVRAIALSHGIRYVVGRKRRLGDRAVDFIPPDHDVAGREVVLVDDVASTGKTLEAAARWALESGAARVAAVVTHGLFLEHAEERLRKTGLSDIWSSDSVPHDTNAIHLAALLAAELERSERA